ncbi:hypothetical protein [Massilia varians]|uniref:hypothetical protein n=1 Tax=Massilia varians TaxID=457921 RepID=UPI002557080D|nr:hypothetical protein [Massilia varians]MDK6077944.1 hypothetical protein [Massilia varians]
MLPVESPFKTYTGLDGKPLDNGYVYFGQPDKDPIAHPVTVYWDAAGTVPAAQPLRTVNGYIMNAGTPANVFVDGAYSELVKDAKARQVFYAVTSDSFSVTKMISEFLAKLAATNGSKIIGFLQAGVGAVVRTIYDKLTDTVNVFDFMTPEQIADVKKGKNGGGQIDVTDAWTKAQAAASRIRIPAGYHRLTNFRPRPEKMFEGDGYYASWIVQGDPAQYAFNALSDAAVGPSHLWGVTLDKVGLRGAPGATKAAVNVEANGAYSVQGGVFRFATENVYQALRIWCPDAANVYNCKFEVLANIVTGAPAVRTAGAYNTYDLFLTSLAGKALESWDGSGIFNKVITENAQEYNGYDNEIRNAKVEYWSGAASSFAAIRLNGTNNRLYNWTINGVPNSKANCGLYVNADTRQTIIGGWITGVYADDRCPQYGVALGANSAGVIADVHSSSPQKVDYVGWAVLKNWQFLGAVNTITDLYRAPGRLRYRWALPTQGSTITMEGYDELVYLQSFGITAVTIKLPPNPDDGQIVRVSSSLAISGITWDAGAGKAVDGQIPTSLAAGGSTAMMYFGSQGQTRWVPAP